MEGEGEYKHSSYLIYKKYIDLIEAQLSEFIHREKITADILYRECESVDLDNNRCKAGFLTLI